LSILTTHFITQKEISDLLELNLSENQAEILASRLKGWNLGQHDTPGRYICDRQNEMKHFFVQANSLILEIILILLWTPALFVGCSKLLVKAVLQHTTTAMGAQQCLQHTTTAMGA